jgi:glycosidase
MRVAAAMLLTLPGHPFVYYGEELGMHGQKPDPHLREPMRWYRTGKGPGEPQSIDLQGRRFRTLLRHSRADTTLTGGRLRLPPYGSAVLQ